MTWSSEYSPQGQGLQAITTMPRAGKVADSSPRAMVISPLSSGWRSASMTSVRNSGNSSRNSTPQCARLTSPGRTRPVPPPSRLALLASWWGAKNGGRVSRSSPGSSAPASEWIAVSSSDSSRRQVGQEPGIRSASVVLPGPLRPGEHQVVAAGRGDLDGVAGVGHAEQVGHVELLQPLLTAPGQQPAARHRRDRRRLGHLVAAQLGGDLGQRAHAEHGHAGHHRRLAGLRLGHEDAA